MGWNSWYIHYGHVTDQHMRTAADQMIASGMADYGYQYVNIDDCWMNAPKQGKFIRDPQRVGPARDAEGNILPNRFFPDMKAMTDYIHAKGLKAGIYTSPGPLTCGGYTGSYQHEAQDARQFAEWGFDFLKYDWCSYGSVAGGTTLDKLQKPYRLMWGELQKLDRDIVFNLCQYGKGEVWKWGGEMGNCWRTTRDLGGTKVTSLPGFYTIGFMNAEHWEYARPGGMERSRLHSHRLGGRFRANGREPPDLADAGRAIRLHVDVVPDGGALDLQRRHGQARSVHAQRPVQPRGDRRGPGPAGPPGPHRAEDRPRVRSGQGPGRRLEGAWDCSTWPPTAAPIAVEWSDLDLTGKQRVRDLWRQKDLGTADGAYEAIVPRHGVLLLRMWPDATKQSPQQSESDAGPAL